MPRAALVRLADLPVDRPMPLIDRQRVIGDRMMISRVILHPGFTLASHEHENEQFVVMLRGRAEFDLDEDGVKRTVEMRTGQVLVLPAHVPHACRAIEECEILDLFSPVSEKTGVDRR